MRKFILLVLVVISSCSSPYFKTLSGSGNCAVTLEARKQLGFELRFVNFDKNNLKNLTITFDNKYFHSLSGLYSVEKGLLKDSVFNAGDTLTFKFTEEIDNSIYFNINERNYVPEEIILSNNECSSKWEFN